MDYKGQTTPIAESVAYIPDVVWHMTEVKMPDKADRYIVNIKFGEREYIDIGYFDLETFTPTDGDTWPEGAEVTHWMQLPDPA